MDANQENHELAETLDRCRIMSCQYAGKQLKKYGHIPYSPEIIRLKIIDKWIRKIIHRMQITDNTDEILQLWRQKISETGIDIPNDLDNCKRIQKANRCEMITTINEELKHLHQRQTFQNELIEKAIQAINKEKAQRLRRIQQAKTLKEVWQKCARARGLMKDNGLSYVLVPENPDTDPTTCTQWKLIDDPSEMEKAKSTRLQTHFGQAQECT
jgi:hypothetical protein